MSFISNQSNPLWMPYCQMKTATEPIEVAETEGVRLILKDGRELIDGISSWWTACHGYRHPKIVASIVEQAQKMPHVMMGGIVHEQADSVDAAACRNNSRRRQSRLSL